VALIEIQEVSKLFGFGDAATLALDEAGLSVEKANLCYHGPQRLRQVHTYEHYRHAG
jgi:hypothetical protein